MGSDYKIRQMLEEEQGLEVYELDMHVETSFSDGSDIKKGAVRFSDMSLKDFIYTETSRGDGDITIYDDRQQANAIYLAKIVNRVY